MWVTKNKTALTWYQSISVKRKTLSRKSTFPVTESKSSIHHSLTRKGTWGDPACRSSGGHRSPPCHPTMLLRCCRWSPTWTLHSLGSEAPPPWPRARWLSATSWQDGQCQTMCHPRHGPLSCERRQLPTKESHRTSTAQCENEGHPVQLPPWLGWTASPTRQHSPQCTTVRLPSKVSKAWRAGFGTLDFGLQIAKRKKVAKHRSISNILPRKEIKAHLFF